MQLLDNVLKENARIYRELPNDYTTCLKIVREWRDVTFEELAERTLINERTIRRIINGESQGSLESLILICLGLHLPPEISNHIIEKSPFSLNYSNEDHIYYQFALNANTRVQTQGDGANTRGRFFCVVFLSCLM